MNRDQAKALRPIIAAFAEGKEIQRLHNGQWLSEQTEMVIFSGPNDEYRIKPEPQWRPWTADEMPKVLALIDKDTGRHHLVEHGKDWHTCEPFTPVQLFAHFEWLRPDGSVTPAGVQVTL